MAGFRAACTIAFADKGILTAAGSESRKRNWQVLGDESLRIISGLLRWVIGLAKGPKSRFQPNAGRAE